MKFLTTLLLFLLFLGNANLNADPQITASELEVHIKYLASDELKGRKPGTPGGIAAAEYIRSQFQMLGMTPLKEDFFHQFKLISNVEPGKNNSFEFASESYTVKTDFIPMSFSANASASGEVVFAGYGLDVTNDSLRWNDYEDIDPSGKWVIILRGDPDNEKPVSRFSDYSQDRMKIVEAQDRKASGILLVSPTAFEKKDKLITMFYDKISSGSQIPVINITRALADKILAETKTTIDILVDSTAKLDKPVSVATNSIVNAEADVLKTKVDAQNVAGIIVGSDPNLKDEFILIGGHYDHLGMGGPGSGSRNPDTSTVHNGADDNASGIAGILEIAELITDAKPKRSLVVVAFDAEEMGILGSSRFVKDSVIDIAALKSMINIDMIGRLDRTSKSIMVGGSGTSPISEEICDVYKKDLAINFSKEGLGPSDHASFYVADVPVFFISTGAHEDYHTPEDDIDKINFDGTVQVAQFAADLTLDLLNREEALTFTKAGPKVRVSSRKLKVTLGIMPDFTGKKADGLGIAAVSKGGPAEASGMLKGDLITAMNGMPVKNIYEYMARLKKLKPGQQITVDILRDDKKIVLIVDL